MSQSTFGKKFTVTTWGESHGKALGAVVDGVPAVFSLQKQIYRFILTGESQDRAAILPPALKAMT